MTMPETQELGESGSGMHSRSQSFNQCLDASGSSMPDVVVPPPSLANDQERENMQTPQRFTPTSVLHATSLSANGVSAGTASRRIIGGFQMKTSNGMSADTYAKSFPLMKPVGGVGTGTL